MRSNNKGKFNRSKSNKNNRSKSNFKSKSYNRQPQEEQNQAPQKENNLDKKTLLAMRSEDQINKIKEYYKLILLDPQSNFKHLDTIFIFIKSSNVKIATTAMRVLAEIFINTAPLEAVDVKQIQQRKEVKITKDEFQVLRFQQLLVNQYQRYLKLLKQLNLKLNANNFSSDTDLFIQFRKCMLQCLVKCYRTLWNFNHFKLLNQLLIKFIKQEECQAVLIELLSSKNVAMLKVKAKIINGIAVLVKEKAQAHLPDNLVKIVNSTYIDTRYLQKDQEILKFKKKKLTKKLYKQQQMDKKKDRQARKERENQKAQKGGLKFKAKIKQQKAKQKLKVRQQVNKQFAQGQAVVSNKQLVKSNSAILQEIFYIYFKIIVENVRSKYLKDSLDGILSFAHLINIDLITNLIVYLDNSAQQLRELWLNQKNNHTMANRLFLIFTSQSLLNGPLSVYNMDDLKVTTNLYKLLKDINKFDFNLTKQHFRMLGITLQEILLKRRQLSQEVVGSLLKELSLIILRKQIPKFYLLQVIRQIASKYSKITKMFEPDNEGFGLNGFNQHSEDPQCSNAINTEIFSNLQKLLQKQTKKVKRQGIDGQKEKIKQIIECFKRLNFNRPQGCLSLQQLLSNDLQIIYQKIH